MAVEAGFLQKVVAVVAVVFQRSIVGGLAWGAVKG
jgi:hypothetical protein